MRGIQAVLADLSARRMIYDRVLIPEHGASPPHYWHLRIAGARAMGIPYASQYRKRSTQAMIGYRGLLLDLIRRRNRGGGAGSGGPAGTAVAAHLQAVAQSD